MSTCPTCGAKYAPNIRFCTKDGAVLEDDAETPEQQQVGKVLAGKYRLDAALSHGGMGVVYRATHVMLNKPVAVKLIKSDLAVSPEIARRFQREARAASNLNHPNIVAVYDLGQTEDGMLYIAMELVNGPSLKDVIKNGGPMESGRILRVLRPVVSALSLAHRNGIVHRDLKPQNIMLADGEVPKLLDFGIAKTFDDATVQLTATGYALGTPQYMSPEQALGKSIDARADLYSLGIIIYEMLVGEVPFSDQSTAAILVKQVNEQPVRPSLRRSDVDPALEAISLKCMEKDPANRYQSADEVMRALDAIAGSPQTAAGAATAAPAAGVWDATLPAAATVALPQGTQPAGAAVPTVRQTVVSPPAPTPATPVQSPAAARPPVPETHPTVPMPVAAQPAAPAPAAAKAAPPPRSGSSLPILIGAVAVLILIGVAAGAWQMGYFKFGARPSTPGTAQNTPADTTTATPPATEATPPATAGEPSGTPATGAPPVTPPAGEVTPPVGEPSMAVGGPGKQPGGASGLASRFGTRPGPPAAGKAAPGRRSATSAAAGQPGAAVPAARRPAIPENPSVFVRCAGAAEICAAARTAFSQAIQRDGMAPAPNAEAADIVLEANAAMTDERQEEQYGTNFVVRTYTLDVDGRATRFRETVPMPEPRTFSFDARYGRDRAMENARVVANGAVESVRAYWKKKSE